MNTPSMIVGPSIILLQPHVGRFLASDWAKIEFSADFQATFGHQVVPQRCRLATIVLVGIVYMYNKVMNTPSMIVGPSIILLQPHVCWFHASDEGKI